MTERELFEAALELSPEHRAAYLDDICGGDAALRQRLQALLRKHDRAGSFLENAAVPALATIEEPVREGPGTVIGPYKLMEQIGEGGMGLVFVAEQQQPVRRKVALKVIKPGMDSAQVIARFEAERQALALMDHPHIARVLDAGATALGRPYFVMELVKGVPITQFCDDNRLTAPERLGLFISVCQAVQHAHQKGIIHRDLKPSNVLVTSHDGRPVVKVIDFGVAKAVGQQLTEKTVYTGFAQMIGTPLYMSPEQAGMSSLDIDTRTDIYALGVLLYELLTGTTPFDKERLKAVGFDELRRIIREEEPPRPSTRISTLGQAATTVSAHRKSDPKRLSRLCRGELDWIVMKALEKDRNRRYETANGFAMDVQRYLADEPVLACPPAAGYRLRKFVRRNKGPVLTTTLVLLALVAGIIGTTWQAVRADQRAEGERLAKLAEADRAEGERKAKQQAQQEKANAEVREAEIKAVLDFVESKIFAAARPKDLAGGQGYDVKLADAVKAALPFVDKSFTKQPLIEARLRATMGISFSYLSDAKTAIEQQEKARALYSRHRGPDHPDTVHSMNNLAVAYEKAGRTQEAIRLFEETLRLRKANLGPEHPDTLSSMNNLANTYTAAGRTQEALKLHEETFELRKAKLGPDHPDTLHSMHNLALSYVAAGREREALELREKTLPLLKAKLGPDHPDIVMSMTALANSYFAAGRLQEALNLREEIRDLAKAKLGPEHAATLLSMFNLANSYSAARRVPEAVKLHEETLQLMKAKLGHDHPKTLNSMNSLANAYDDAGRGQEALKLYEETLRLSKAKLGADHPDTLKSMNNLATSYHYAGRSQEAVKLHEETLRLTKAKLGRAHPDTLASMNNLAGSYIAAGEAAKAVALLQETIALRERRVKAKPGQNMEQSFLAWTHGLMGEAEEGRRDYSSAVRAYSRSVEMFDQLDQAGVLKHPFFRAQLSRYRQRLALSRKVEQAVKDLDFALKQPAAVVPQLLDLRVRFLLKEQKLAAAVETAGKMKEMAGEKAVPLYDAACLYALCAGTAKKSVADAADSGKLADQAMALLKQAVARGYKNAGHMKRDKDLDTLRDRDDFKKLLAELEGKQQK
jgi:serine/threonine protein kinase/tetratricopeptide (TPR) repeat protein